MGDTPRTDVLHKKRKIAIEIDCDDERCVECMGWDCGRTNGHKWRVADSRSQECLTAERELAAMTRERDELRSECERERLRLAACGVVALANTPESAAQARQMNDEYRSGSLDDVIRCVDSEMALRAEVERLTRERDTLLRDHCERVSAEEAWRETRESRAKVERLRALLRLFDGHACQCAHHAKKDQHPVGTPCPIEQRIRADLTCGECDSYQRRCCVHHGQSGGGTIFPACMAFVPKGER